MIDIPRLAVVARDDEVDFLATDARADDLRSQQPTVFQGDHLLPPALRGDVGKGLAFLPCAAAVGRAQPLAADERALGGADDWHQPVLALVAKRAFFAGLRIENDGAIC